MCGHWTAICVYGDCGRLLGTGATYAVWLVSTTSSMETLQRQCLRVQLENRRTEVGKIVLIDSCCASVPKYWLQHIRTDAGIYSGLAFLTDAHLILPNVRTRSLEVWQVSERSSDESGDKSPVARLALPPLSEGWVYHVVSCRGDPNPMGATSKRRSTDPFQPSPDTALLLLNVYVHHERPATLNANDIHVDAFTMLVPRNSILQTLMDNPKELILPWEKWSSKVRILSTSDDGSNSNWITTTSGLRYITFDKDHEIVLRDYNRFNKDLVKEGEEVFPLRKALYDERERTVSLDFLIDDEPLPATVIFGGIKEDWSGALLDEERIIGLRVRRLRWWNSKMWLSKLLCFVARRTVRSGCAGDLALWMIMYIVEERANMMLSSTIQDGKTDSNLPVILQLFKPWIGHRNSNLRPSDRQKNHCTSQVSSGRDTLVQQKV